MLDHPWLNMKPNYEYTMSEETFTSWKLKKKIMGDDDDKEEVKQMSELCTSEEEHFGADSEDYMEGD